MRMCCRLTSPDRVSSGIKDETGVEREGSTGSCVVISTCKAN